MTCFEVKYLGNLRTLCRGEEGRGEVVMDAPKDNHGEGLFFSPTDLLAVSLAGCTVTLLGIVGKRLGVDLSGLRATASKEMSKNSPRRIAKVSIQIFCPLEPSEGVKKELEEAAIFCPVHHSLHPSVIQEIVFYWGKP